MIHNCEPAKQSIKQQSAKSMHLNDLKINISSSSSSCTSSVSNSSSPTKFLNNLTEQTGQATQQIAEEEPGESKTNERGQFIYSFDEMNNKPISAFCSFNQSTVTSKANTVEKKSAIIAKALSSDSSNSNGLSVNTSHSQMITSCSAKSQAKNNVGSKQSQTADHPTGSSSLSSSSVGSTNSSSSCSPSLSSNAITMNPLESSPTTGVAVTSQNQNKIDRDITMGQEYE
jgi:hypothetical protein